MGTNFYYREEFNVCQTCKRPHEVKEIHIGKRSYGWNFLFSSYKKSYEEWVKFIKKHPDNLYDEYKRKVTADEMIDNFNAKGKRHSINDYFFEVGEYDFSSGDFS